MNHCMLDLETLGKTPGSIILSIGAVIFDADGIHNKFYQLVDPKTCEENGLRADAETVMWWMRQSQEAREALLEGGKACLFDALAHFSEWLPEGIPLWGNGSDFDNSILEAGFRAVGITPPWQYWQNRCFKTARALHPEIAAPVEPIIKHHALYDAIAEAEHLRKILAAYPQAVAIR
jgi:hypothetical protein